MFDLIYKILCILHKDILQASWWT